MLNPDFKFEIEKDGLPFVRANEKVVLFGYGGHSFEYTWQEMHDVCKADYESFLRKQEKLREIKLENFLPPKPENPTLTNNKG